MYTMNLHQAEIRWKRQTLRFAQITSVPNIDNAMFPICNEYT